MHTMRPSLKHLPVLICLVAVLWLATACEDDQYVWNTGVKIVAALLATAHEAGLREEGLTCTTESPELVSRMNTSEEEYQKHRSNSIRASAVLHNYKSLFWRQPNVHEVSKGFLRDGKGGWTDTWGISVWVTEKVDQSALSPGDRIPDHIEGVPVQITDEDPLPRAPESACNYDTCITNSSEREENMAETSTDITPERMERIHKVRLKYDPLFWRQPNVFGVGEGFLRDGRGGWLETVGINVKVTKRVDQSILPPEDRIPDCLEGVPVKITEGSPGRIIPPLWVPVDTDEEETNGSS